MKDQESLKPLTRFLSNYIKVEQDVIDFLEGTAEYRRFDKKDIIQQQGQSQKYLGFIL
jgi:hypothetical protein